MTKTKAKKLTVGAQVIWNGADRPGAKGIVIRKRYNTVFIRWADIGEVVHYVETMDNVFTQEQLDQLEEEKRVAESIAALTPDQRCKGAW